MPLGWTCRDFVLSPTSKPYLDAIISLEAGIAQKDGGSSLVGKQVYEEKLEALRNLDLLFGTVVYSTGPTQSFSLCKKRT